MSIPAIYISIVALWWVCHNLKVAWSSCWGGVQVFGVISVPILIRVQLEKILISCFRMISLIKDCWNKMWGLESLLTELGITAQQTKFKSRSQYLLVTKIRGWEGKANHNTKNHKITKDALSSSPITMYCEHQKEWEDGVSRVQQFAQFTMISLLFVVTTLPGPLPSDWVDGPWFIVETSPLLLSAKVKQTK